MLDSDLADLYRVTTKALNRAVKRNPARFPETFMFQLSDEEISVLRYQIGSSNSGRGGRRYRPFAFTEHGAVMLASVLNSKMAIEASIQVVTAFVRLRSILSAHKELAKKLELHVQSTGSNFKIVFDLIRKHLPDNKKKSKIGFRTK